MLYYIFIVPCDCCGIKHKVYQDRKHFILGHQYRFVCHYKNKITLFKTDHEGVSTMTEPREWWPVGLPSAKAVAF
ncbi:hypothetical protein ACQEXU_08825 [Vibrio sp. TRT 21S02]|uniref:hypothetical protein n=1 Tax=unclassified Vibrio TaxID=2614977 RepID=UPI00349F1F18